MAIPITRYVDITSGVGAAAALGARELVARLISDNPLIPTGEVLSFSNLNDVADYFGSDSEEYDYAAAYFGWISKNITTPPSLQFVFWPEAATAPLIYGLSGAQTYNAYTGISAGTFTLQMGAFTYTLTGLNFASAVSLADVAAVVEAAINAKTGGGALWTAATVTWNSTRQSFDLVGGATGAAVISVTAGGGGGDVAAQLGWLSPSTILSDGSAAQTVTNFLVDLVQADNNFGSFAFLASLALTIDDVEDAAIWNDAQNNDFMYSVPVSAANATAWSAALIGYSGVTLTLSPIADEFPELIPMMILAATDYNARNSTQNYMFQLNFDVTASVTSSADANAYDALRINYYGNVQQAGQYVSFYQRGNMMGGTTDAVDQNTYANEIWLKDSATVALMNLLLALSQIPANNTGRGQVLSQLQAVIAQALYNGTIIVGKGLTNQQKLFITNATGDSTAWLQVQNSGYWIDAVIETYQNEGVTNYKIVYTLIYSKNDVIRLIEGRDILI